MLPARDRGERDARFEERPQDGEPRGGTRPFRIAQGGQQG